MADESKQIDLILRIDPIIRQVHSKCCWLACYGMGHKMWYGLLSKRAFSCQMLP